MEESTGMAVKSRISWLDTAKCLGMFMIYLGHFGEASGRGYEFVFNFHVALFVFLSGCSENLTKKRSILGTIKNSAKNIMIPFYFYAMLSTIINVVVNDATIDKATILNYFLLILQGCIRNSFFAPGLWFLSCIFLMKIIFSVLYKFVNKWIILGISVVMFLISICIIDPIPVVTPHGIYNWDSVMYYFLMYAIGFILFPYLEKLLDSTDYRKYAVITIMTVCTVAYSATVYFEHDIFSPFYGTTEISLFSVKQISALLMILATVFISYWLRNIAIMNDLGRDTLNLCGSEWIIKTVLPTLLSIFGINVNLSNPLQTYLYCAVCMYLAYKIVSPAVHTILNKNFAA